MLFIIPPLLRYVASVLSPPPPPPAASPAAVAAAMAAAAGVADSTTEFLLHLDAFFRHRAAIDAVYAGAGTDEQRPRPIRAEFEAVLRASRDELAKAERRCVDGAARHGELLEAGAAASARLDTTEAALAALGRPGAAPFGAE